MTETTNAALLCPNVSVPLFAELVRQSRDKPCEPTMLSSQQVRRQAILGFVHFSRTFRGGELGSGQVLIEGNPEFRLLSLYHSSYYPFIIRDTNAAGLCARSV